MSSFLRRHRLLVLCGLLLALLAGGLAFLSLSSSGLRLLAATMTSFTAGSGVEVRLEGVSGRLIGPLEVARLRVMTAGGGVEAEAVDLDWSPRQLLTGRLQVPRLQVALLRILPGTRETPKRAPERLVLPLAADFAQVRVDRLVLRPASGVAASPDATAPVDTPLLQALTGRLESDGAQHRWQLAGQLAGGPVSFTSGGRVDGSAVPQVQANTRLLARHGERSVTLDAAADGPLARLPLRLGMSGDAQGTGEVLLTPFAPLSLASLDLQLRSFDPGLWLAGAGQALLDLELALRPTGEGFAGPLRLRNAQAGPLDRGRWPLRAVQGDLRWSPTQINLDGLDVALPAGQVRGHLQARRAASAGDASPPGAALQSPSVLPPAAASAAGAAPSSASAAAPLSRSPSPGQLSAWQVSGQLRLQDVDPARLHGAARPARLRGEVELAADTRRQTLRGRLAEPRFTLRFAAEREGSVLRLQQGTLSGSLGQAQLSGRLDLAERRAFRLEGQVERLQPHRLAALPAMDLRGRVLAEGFLLPAWQLRLDLNLDGSRIEGQAVDLHGSLVLDGVRRLVADLRLQQAANAIQLVGALGAANDRLRLQFDAPRLQVAGLRLRGQGEVLLAGRLDRPGGQADLRLDELAVGERWQLAGLTVQAAVPADAGPLSLRVQLAALRGSGDPGGQSGQGGQGGQSGQSGNGGLGGAGSNASHGSNGTEWLRQAEIVASGTLAAHRITAAAGYGSAAAGGRLRLELAGGVQKGAARRWVGQLTQAELTPPSALALSPFVLAAPASLEVDAQRVALADLRLESPSGMSGPSRLSSPGGASSRLRLGRLLWHKDAGLRVAEGTAEDLPLAPFLPAAFVSSDLQLRGQWRFDAERPAGNRVQVERSRGDLRFAAAQGGGQAVALGMSEFAATADLSRPGRVDVSALVSGERLGTARATLALARDGVSLAVDRAAPWQGQLAWTLPDLGFLGPLAAPGVRTGGRLSGDIALHGTPQEPRFSGTVSGQGLELVWLENGLHLTEGELQLRLEQQALVVQQLRFKDGSRQAAPREELAKLAGGGVSARGSLDLAARSGILTVDFERLGVMQRRDIWLRASGQGKLNLRPERLEVRGALRVDGAAFHLGPGFGTRVPELSEDVVVLGRSPGATGTSGTTGTAGPATAGRRRSVPLDVDLSIVLGDACYLRMKEVDSRLVGDLRVQARPGNPPRVAGSVRTEGGVFNVYGQRLAIERGILNFQGPLDNPGLNILAMRREQPVAAGVEVTGTALKPRVRLVSEPLVSDTDKLSWLVLGRGTEQLGGNDPGMLAAVAKALLAETGGEGTLENIQRRLGVAVSIREGQIGTGQQAPASAVVGAKNTTTAGTRNTVVGVSTRLGRRVSLSLEQVVGLGEQLASITLELSRSLSLVLSAGVDHSVDLRYGVDFGGRQEPPAPVAPAPAPGAP